MLSSPKYSCALYAGNPCILGTALTGNSFSYLLARIKRHPEQGVGTENLQNPTAVDPTLPTELDTSPAPRPARAVGAPRHAGAAPRGEQLHALHVPNVTNVRLFSPRFSTQHASGCWALLVGLGHPHGTCSRSIPVPLRPLLPQKHCSIAIGWSIPRNWRPRQVLPTGNPLENLPLDSEHPKLNQTQRPAWALCSASLWLRVVQQSVPA